MDSEEKKPKRGFELAIAVVIGGAVLAWVVLYAALGLSLSEKEALEARRARLASVVSEKGQLPTAKSIEVWKKYQKDLSQVRTDVDDALHDRDGNLEKYFEEFDPQRGSGARFRVLYAEKTDALYKRSAPVLIRDMNGQPVKATEVFTFDAWEWEPGKEEVRLGQKKYWIIEAVVDALLDLIANKEEGRLGPMLARLDVANPPPGTEPDAIYEVFESQVDVILDPRDVPALLAGLLGPGKHGLLTRLIRLNVTKTDTLKLEYKFEVEEGQEITVKPEKYLKPVRVKLAFDVLDLRFEK